MQLSKYHFSQEVDLLYSGLRLSPSKSWFDFLSLYFTFKSGIFWCKIKFEIFHCWMRVTWDKQAKRLKNPNDKKLHNSGGGLLIVYNNQREEHRFVQPFVIIGKVGKPFVIIGGVEKHFFNIGKQTNTTISTCRSVPRPPQILVEQSFERNTLIIKFSSFIKCILKNPIKCF